MFSDLSALSGLRNLNYLSVSENPLKDDAYSAVSSVETVY